MAELLITPSQTIGPFFKYGLEWPGGESLFPDSAQGRRIRLGGVVTDFKDEPVPDALIEFWQADAKGQFGAARAKASGGFGRVATDERGRYAINTIFPGPVAGANGRKQAPHILVVLFARGLLAQVVTRVYFEGEAANKDDPVLALCGVRASTLMAKRVADDANAYDWDISLQGQNETVFFEA
ncbi:MAG TPA: protocatechuate 3,4-dioxygenase subunit alpha [Burkholderiales bacterium]|nr:protocatechuate 3,4-dioxygenase subunit alpha [Burkholderiales bacterium]